MLIETILAVLCGIALGTVTGLTPGIHINLVAALILLVSKNLTSFPTEYLAFAILAMSITHVFLDIIPSVFLGAPDANEVLAVLPGHRLLMQGLGYQAVAISALGALSAIILGILASPLTIVMITKLFEVIKPYIGWILIAASFLLVIKESGSKVAAALIFLFSGVLGLAVFGIETVKEPLFPLLSGLFGISTLLISISQNTKIPQQYVVFPAMPWKEWLKLTPLATIVSSLFSFLPALGPTQATILASSLTRELSAKSFLFLNAGINAVNMLTSILSLYAIEKARNGAIVVMGKLAAMNSDLLIKLLIITAVTAILACGLSLLFARGFANIMQKINYRGLIIGIILFIVVLLPIISGWLGLMVAAVATLVGLLPSVFNTGKNHLMGCLLLPTILYFML